VKVSLRGSKGPHETFKHASLRLFNLFLTAFLSPVEKTSGAQSFFLKNKLTYSDYIDEMTETPWDLQVVANNVLEGTSSFEMIVNASKNKSMCYSQKPQDTIKRDPKLKGKKIQ
jgi:hypothetical protein